MTNKIIFVSRNEGKIKELQSIVNTPSLVLLSLEDINYHQDIPEDYHTFHENSLQKAKTIYEQFKISCIADDSGLSIEALNGAPGVFSARYGPKNSTDQEKNALILAQMLGKTNRRAFFTTVITSIMNGEIKQFEGIVHGEISITPKGLNGFGYDPIFIPESANKTFAEMSLNEKSKYSHRAIALKKLLEYLETV